MGEKGKSLHQTGAGKKLLVFLLVFAMVLSSASLVGAGRIQAKAAASGEVVFYYYDPECSEDSCLALGLNEGTWGKLENVGTNWIGSFAVFDKLQDGWHSCTIKYDPEQYSAEGVGMAVARVKKDATAVSWETDILNKFDTQ